MPICIVGDPEDLASVYLGWLARRQGLDVLELPEALLGVQWSFGFHDLHPASGVIEAQDTSLRFADVWGVFVRFNPEPPLPPGLELSLAQGQGFVSERRGGMHHLLESLPCVVVNRPSGGRSNGSKPFQMQMLADAGFKVPAWIASNDEDAVRQFAERHKNDVIYKACSGLRARVRRLDAGMLARLRQGTSPIIVQEYIPGRDVRIHTVQDRAFPTEVLGPGIDYRFEHEGAEYRPACAPDEITERCCRVAEREGLTLAGFDFRVTAEGCWYCLEMNPVPSFLPYEMQTGQPIAQAILDTFH